MPIFRASDDCDRLSCYALCGLFLNQSTIRLGFCLGLFSGWQLVCSMFLPLPLSVSAIKEKNASKPWHSWFCILLGRPQNFESASWFALAGRPFAGISIPSLPCISYLCLRNLRYRRKTQGCEDDANGGSRSASGRCGSTSCPMSWSPFDLCRTSYMALPKLLGLYCSHAICWDLWQVYLLALTYLFRDRLLLVSGVVFGVTQMLIEVYQSSDACPVTIASGFTLQCSSYNSLQCLIWEDASRVWVRQRPLRFWM